MAEVLRDFQALGQVFGIVETPKVTPLTDFRPERESAFLRLSVKEQLIRAADEHSMNGEQAHFMKRTATRSALDMDPEARAKQQIECIAIVPLTQEGKIDVSDTLQYPIYTVFKSKKGWRFVGMSRRNMQRTYDGSMKNSPEILEEIDALVTNQATLRQESGLDYYNRMRTEIKTADGIIKEHKTQVALQRTEVNNSRAYDVGKVVFVRDYNLQMEDMNHRKQELILSYLQASEKLLAEHPHLAMPYTLHENGEYDNLHRTLEMRSPFEVSFKERLLDPATPIQLRDGVISFSTNMNMQMLTQRARAYMGGSDQEQDRIAYAISSYLGVKPVRKNYL